MKRCSKSLIIREMQIKPQWGTISGQSEWQLSKSLQTINAGEGVEKGNPLTLLVGMQTSRDTLENRVEIPLKTGTRTAIWPCNPITGHTHQGNQNWKRRMYPNVHHSTVYNSQDMEATLMSIGRRMDKKVVVHIHNGILISYKKEHIWVSSNEVDETGAYYTEWNKSERW